jgi:D-beta-D-heptose 7-phosphate kinase/D-beta-D-heptose 1-phosphate adenosyltransferase
VTRVTVVGDALLDRDWSGTVHRVTPDAPVPVVDAHDEHRRPGGAGLAAALAAGTGCDVTLVTALGTDAAAGELRGLLDDVGVAVVDLGLDGPTPEKLRIRAADQSIARVDRGCHPVLPPGPWTDEAGAALAEAQAVLVADYGRGMAERALPAVRHLAARQRPTRSPAPAVVWDPHAAGPTPPAGLAAVTPNLAEAAALDDGARRRPSGTAPPAAAPAPHPTAPGHDAGVVLLAGRAERLAVSWGSPVVLTSGERGAVVAAPPRPPAIVPTTPARGDTCGAGDCLAATLTAALARSRPLPVAAALAVAAAGRFVRGEARIGPAPIPPVTEPSDVTADPGGPAGTGAAVTLAARVRAEGGTVVAAGGCFDLLHPGHLRTLEAARALGDCLVVCLNGDRSVRRLKGPGRPVNPQDDRARLLLGLRCVDAVATFDEDTPVELLARLRPHVFAKGGDYAGMAIPEAAVLAGWGGRVVTLPLVADRSTSRLIERATARTG